MKFSPLIAPVAVLLIIAYTQTFAGAGDSQQVRSNSAQPSEPVSKVADSCHQSWLKLNWRIGENGMLAKNNPAFDAGIQRVCQAKAELFFEGYEISPFIAADSQQQVYPIVFRPSVDEIKAQIRLNLPKLRLI